MSIEQFYNPERTLRQQERLVRLSSTYTLALGLPYQQVANFKDAIVDRLGNALIDRGEAHQTILPPIFSQKNVQLTQYINPEELTLLDAMVGRQVNVLGIGSLPYLNLDGSEMGLAELQEFIRLQESQEKPVSTTLFLVMEELPSNVVQVLHSVKQRFAINNPDIQIASVNPHCTIGFTHTDRFEPKVVNNKLSRELEEYLTQLRQEKMVYQSIVGQRRVPIVDKPQETMLVYEEI